MWHFAEKNNSYHQLSRSNPLVETSWGTRLGSFGRLRMRWSGRSDRSCGPGVRVHLMSFHWRISTFKLGSGLNGFQTSQDDSQRSQHFLHHVRQASDFFVGCSVVRESWRKRFKADHGGELGHEADLEIACISVFILRPQHHRLAAGASRVRSTEPNRPCEFSLSLNIPSEANLVIVAHLWVISMSIMRVGLFVELKPTSKTTAIPWWD